MSQPGSDGGSAQPRVFLIPWNDTAIDASVAFLGDPRNQNYVQVDRESDRKTLCVHFGLKTSVTLGASHCDIAIPPIDRQQCHFELHPTTNAVVLTDDSRKRTTQVYDDTKAVYLTKENPSVIVSPGINHVLFIGPLQFYLKWPQAGDLLHAFLEAHPSNLGPKWREVDNDEHQYRYLSGEELGSGASGVVRKAVDIRTGAPMAVKRLRHLNGQRYTYAKREIKTMTGLFKNTSDLEGKHILPIYDYELGEDKTWIEIFLPLKEGSVPSLVYSPRCMYSKEDIAARVLYQMAKALKFLEKNELIHRDVKPENILYETRFDDQNRPYYHFLLADFGLARETVSAATMKVGTRLYMAPEVSGDEKPRKQTCKVDIWSLFVTVVWIRDTEGFRDYHGSEWDWHKVVEFSERDEYANIYDMAELDYKSRVSASELVMRLEGRAPAPARQERPSRSGRGDSRRGSGAVEEAGGADYLLEAEPSNYTHAAAVDGNYPPAMAGYSALPGLVGGDEAVFVYPTVYNEANMRDNYYPRDQQDDDMADDGSDTRKGKNKARDKGRERKHRTRF